MELINYANDAIVTKQASTLPEGWNIRIAVRAVLKDNNGRIALLYVGKYNVYKLPGGGVDTSEKLESALAREVLEETGCSCEVEKEIGVFVEQREEWKLFQISFCYQARVINMGEPNYTQEELESGFKLIWVDSTAEAIHLVESNTSERYDDKYIKFRDSSILKKTL